MRFLVIFGVALLIVGSAHYYLWVRLVRDVGFTGNTRKLLTLLFVVMALWIPAGAIASRALSPAAARWVAWPGYAWLGMAFLLLCLVAVGDLGRVIAVGVRKVAGAPANPERRLFVSRLIGGAAVTAGAGLSVWGVRSAHGRPKLVELPIQLANLPPALDGTTIVQLTDLHIGPALGREFTAELVARANALQPDLVAITGDLVDGSVDELRDAVAPLADLRAKHGVFFVTGNHETYSGERDWCAHLPTLGVRVLRNERVRIGDADASFDLAGVDDFNARHDMDQAMAGRDPARACVLLAHQPRSVLEAAKHGVGLQLSGHTHGGQIWPWRYLVFLQQPYVEGLHRHGDTWLYVSRGCGYWGPPMRVNAPSEIVKVTLHVRPLHADGQGA
jgi:predicted MPP superfamily phosphohydrolase